VPTNFTTQFFIMSHSRIFNWLQKDKGEDKNPPLSTL